MIFQNFSPKQRQAMLWWAMPESHCMRWVGTFWQNNGNEHWIFDLEHAEF